MNNNSSDNGFTYPPGFQEPHEKNNDKVISGLKKYRDSIVSDINLYQALFEQVAVGIAIASPDGRWLRINNKICDIFGYTEDELFGRSFLDIRHPDDISKNIDIIYKFLAGGIDNIWLDIRYLNRYNIDGWINLNATVIRNAGGEPGYILFIIDDITIRKEIEENLKKRHSEMVDLNRELEFAHQGLEKKTAELQKASSYKSEFLANMSHELRSPLNSMLVLAQYLAENRGGNLSEDQIKSADIIYKAGNDLLMLINDILDLSRIEAGKMTIYVSESEIKNIAVSIESSFRHLVEKKGLEFGIFISRDLPEKIKIDQQKLEQIIRNFISNSLKFTSQGSVTINISRPDGRVDLSRSGLRHESAIAFSVSDTGIGIPRSKQEEIFEAFQQVDGSISRHYGGTGLGLSISRELAKLLCGEIQLESTEGEGSTFTLYVPREMKISETVYDDRRSERRAKKVITTGAEIKDTLLYGKKILITDNDMRNLFALSKLLQDRGASVLKASNGKAAIEILEKESGIDLVLMEVMMPVMDGYEAMRNIRADVKFRDLPLFAVTSKAMKEDREKCIAAGANEYISKPVDVERLIKLIVKWIEKH
ncbi:MAG: ATP-binding protein [Spirochaetes bacterium]|nr:ATP-binding protein [Spirochaetota bacterium]